MTGPWKAEGNFTAAAGSVPQAGALGVLGLRDGPGLCRWRGLLGLPSALSSVIQEFCPEEKKRKDESQAVGGHQERDGALMCFPQVPLLGGRDYRGPATRVRCAFPTGPAGGPTHLPPSLIRQPTAACGQGGRTGLPGSRTSACCGDGTGCRCCCMYISGDSGPHVTGRASEAPASSAGLDLPLWGCSSTDSESGKGSAAPALGTIPSSPEACCAHPSLGAHSTSGPSWPRASVTSAVAMGTRLWLRDA